MNKKLQKTGKNKPKRKYNKTKKNGGDTNKRKIPSDKSIDRVAVVMTPSALYGNSKILDYVFVNKIHPSFYDMLKTNFDSVEEMLAFIKKNKKPVIHVEEIMIRPVYKEFFDREKEEEAAEEDENYQEVNNEDYGSMSEITQEDYNQMRNENSM